jgi:hypothetical protein
VRQGISELGAGPDTRVSVVLKNKSKLSGYVGSADPAIFTVVDSKTGTATNIAYSDVKRIKGKNLSTGAQIGIGIAIGAAITIVILLILIMNPD